MEIKITADKKLLDALEKIAAALTTAQESRQEAAEAPQTAAPAKAEETTGPASKPATEANNPAESEPAPSRDEIQRLAIVAIQGGHREEVKALIEKFGGTRVKDVPENNLAAFKAGLEALNKEV